MSSVVVFKIIKPSRLNVRGMRTPLRTAMGEAASEIRNDFRATVATWKRKPQFSVQKDLSAPGPYVLVGTDDRVYGFLDRGTRPHIIMPVSRGALSFRWGGPGSYRPKTKPRVIDSFPGGKGRFKRQHFTFVRHPGVVAREFSTEIARRRGPWFKKKMLEVMREVSRVSGHKV